MIETAKEDKKKIDLKAIESGLENMTGFDFEVAERDARAAGDTLPDITFSKNFQARLAARAMGVHVNDVCALPIRDFNAATMKVNNFLFASLAAEIKAKNQ